MEKVKVGVLFEGFWLRGRKQTEGFFFPNAFSPGAGGGGGEGARWWWFLFLRGRLFFAMVSSWHR